MKFWIDILIDISFQVNKEKVVWGIQHHLKLLSHYNDLEILEACGRLDTNCFELRVTGYFSWERYNTLKRIIIRPFSRMYPTSWNSSKMMVNVEFRQWPGLNHLPLISDMRENASVLYATWPLWHCFVVAFWKKPCYAKFAILGLY